MRVRDQQGKVEWSPLEFGEQRLAKPAQPGAAIENEDVTPAADFDAGGVAAVADRARPRCWNRATNSPKLDVRGGFDAKNLAQRHAKLKLKNTAAFAPFGRSEADQRCFTTDGHG